MQKPPAGRVAVILLVLGLGLATASTAVAQSVSRPSITSVSPKTAVAG